MSFEIGPIDDGRPHFLNSGFGVQSTTLALMASAGEVGPMPTAAIFADTGDEPKAVMDWIRWVSPRLAFPVEVVRAKTTLGFAQLSAKIRDNGSAYMQTIIPAHVLKPDGKRGMLGRRCTRDFKIRPIERHLKQRLGFRRNADGQLCTQWLGISMDEAHRMKPSREAWSRHCWPLVALGMTRTDCLRWMDERGFPEPPRSACRYCPFHSDREWVRLRDDAPEDFALAVKFERDLQALAENDDSTEGVPFLHPSCVPLDAADLDGDSGRQMTLGLWGEECSGMCGV